MKVKLNLTTIDVVSERMLREFVPMTEAISAVRNAFVWLAQGLFESPLRTSFDSGRTLVMPVFHVPSGTSTTKSLRIRPGEVPAVRGIVAWISDDREFVLDAHAVTTLRTGAVVGVATSMLAPTDARRLVLIGAGTQAFDQVRAVAATRDIDHVTVVSRTIQSATGLRDSLVTEFPHVNIEATTDPSHSLRTADIVCCATTSKTPVFDAGDLPERVHINAIGSYTLAMRELPVGAFANADVVVDDIAAARHEAGDLMSAIEEGPLDVGLLTELGPRLVEGALGSGMMRTVFKSVGLGIQDWAICRALTMHMDNAADAVSASRNHSDAEASQ